MALLVGLAGATVFWLYGPVLKQEMGRQVEEVVKNQTSRLAGPDSKSPGESKGPGAQALGGRYQIVSNGNQTFLADLKEGRVWRYFHHTREDGHLKDEEGFLPLPFYFGGKKYPAAGEVESGKTGERAGP